MALATIAQKWKLRLEPEGKELKAERTKSGTRVTVPRLEVHSMIVGEPQILGQLKNAYALAKEHGSVSGFLDLVMTRAFNVAKRVRTETEIGSSAVSVSYAAVELARDIFGELTGKRVLLVGAGKMAESAARHLRRAGVAVIAGFDSIAAAA